MATLRDIRRRINSVKSTQQITKAMKMVAAAKLRRSQERLFNSRPYAERLGELLTHLAAREGAALHPLLARREGERTCYVVITADRGLCGSFNANVMRRTREDGHALGPDAEFALITVGKKGFEHFKRRNYDILHNFVGIFDSLDFNHAVEIAQIVRDKFLGHAFDRVCIVYNRFKSAGVQQVTVEQLLPIEPDAVETEAGGFRQVDYLYEPEPHKILDDLCPKNLNVQIWRALLESNASEHASRMIAMDAATENAQEMIYDLTLYYNKVRQAAITKEISEIVGGAEALQS